jgi:hypothetical protein
VARRGTPARREGRRPLIAGNWKMNLTHLEAIGLVQKLAFSLKEPELEAAEVVVLPPFTALRSVQTLVTGDKLEIGYGAQDLSAEFSAEVETTTVPVDQIPDDQLGLDVGPRTVEAFGRELGGARTVFWNGPMGVFELAPFQAGTRGVAEAVAAVDGLSVVGGGDSAAAVRQLGLDEAAYGHISTGGGASLEYLEGRELPGLTVLADGTGQ